MSRLDQAIKLAVEVHEGQVDKGGNPYILHPLRVMCAVEKEFRKSTGLYREDFLCAAVCHDVIEDFDRETFSADYIDTKLRNLSDDCYLAIYALSRVDGESWKNYINRVNENSIAKFVKIYDLQDNCDLTRLIVFNYDDVKRNNMYNMARKFLETGEEKF